MPLKQHQKTVNAEYEQLEHQRLTSLMNSMADAVIAVDQKANIVLYNAATLNLFDVNTITVGSPLSKLLKPVDRNNQPFDSVGLVKSAARTDHQPGSQAQICRRQSH